MDEAIMAYIKRRYNLMIGDATSEQIKIDLGSAYSPDGPEKRTMDIKGRDLISGIPKTITINEDESARPCLSRSISSSIRFGRIGEHTPELAADIVDRGIVLAGGARFSEA